MYASGFFYCTMGLSGAQAEGVRKGEGVGGERGGVGMECVVAVFAVGRGDRKERGELCEWASHCSEVQRV